MAGDLFVALKAWRRGHGGAVRYRCLRRAATDRVAVRSADFCRQPPDPSRRAGSDRRFVELIRAFG